MVHRSLVTGDRYGADGAVLAAPAAAPVVAPAAAPAGEPVVQGFGTKVPLVIALRQVLPTGYTFAHGDGVDLSKSVNWQGGKPWRAVLTDMLASVGLSASVTGETVFIQKSAMPVAAPAAAPVIAPVIAPAATISAPAVEVSTPAITLTPATPVAPAAAPASSSVRPALSSSSMIQTLSK